MNVAAITPDGTKPAAKAGNDTIQARLAAYACKLSYDDLSETDRHATKLRFIDSLAGATPGYFGEPSQIALKLARGMSGSSGTATLFGTREKVSPDMAAFVNGTIVRYAEMND